MFRRLYRAAGVSSFEVSGAAPERFLNMCAGAGLEIISVGKKEDFLLEVSLPSAQKKAAEAIAAKAQCEIRHLGDSGSPHWARLLRRRLAAAVLALGLVGLLFWSKFYVWEINVSGNDSVSTGEILQALRLCGVETGSFWPGFAPEDIRSEMLLHLPELSWISVNMAGSSAEVIVKERTEIPEMVFEGEACDIVADKAGFITEVNALVGTAQVKRGSAVAKGDVLISGVMESSFAAPRFVRSYGTVRAETFTEITAVSPEEAAEKRYTGREKQRFALIIGDNRINFYSDSSISDSFCDKIISVWKAQAEGIFSLPVSIVRETLRYYEVETAETDSYEARMKLEQTLKEALSQGLDDGEVLSENINYSSGGGLIYACLRARCSQEIGVYEPVSPERMAEINYIYKQKADEASDGTQN